MGMKLLAPVARAWAALRARPADPRGGAYHVFGLNNAGVRVTHERAMQVAAVWACIDVIASTASASDWNVYAGTRDATNKEALPDDGLQYVLNTRMNPETSAQAGKRALMIGAAGMGNGYAEIERDMANRIVALWPIAPDRVEPRRELEGGALFYRVTQDTIGGFVDIPATEMFHIRGASLTGFAGDDVIARAIQSIAQAIALDQFGSAYFGNNTQLGTVFVYKSGKLDDAHYDRLKQQLEQRHQGARRAFKSAIMDGGEWDVKSIGTDADKAQLIEAKHLSVEDICRWFRVPPHKVAHLLRSTNNNIEHQGLEFTRDTMRPWIKEIQQEADYKLIAARGPRKFVEIDVDWAEQGDYKSRMEAFQIGRGMGVFSANDILRKLGENTIGPTGDIRIVQGAMVKLEDVGAAYEKTDPTPSAEPDADDGDQVIEDWLRDAFQRLRKRQENRRADLNRAGRPDADVQARRDGAEAAAATVAEIAATAEKRWPGAQMWIEAAAMRVAFGMDPALAAAALVKTLKGTP